MEWKITKHHHSTKLSHQKNEKKSTAMFDSSRVPQKLNRSDTTSDQLSGLVMTNLAAFKAMNDE